jgi:heat-inducible transcriptional repressor
VPTEAGYRYFVDRLLPAEPETGHPRLSLSLVRRELDEAMQVTTEALSQLTNLLAIVSAPPIETSTVRHIEVLVLQPQVLMVVVITSTGGVTKRLFTFARPVDAGLADWAASYLNERLVGLGLGARILHQRLHDPSLKSTESDFLEALAPVFTELEETAQETLYVEGTSRLLRVDRFGDVSELNALMDMLERRVSLLGVLRAALFERDVLVRIGAENDAPALRSLALVAAGYGLPQRRLGAVSVIGPLRMDYGQAIRAVREAAAQLSTFIVGVYDER